MQFKMVYIFLFSWHYTVYVISTSCAQFLRLSEVRCVSICHLWLWGVQVCVCLDLLISTERWYSFMRSNRCLVKSKKDPERTDAPIWDQHYPLREATPALREVTVYLSLWAKPAVPEHFHAKDPHIANIVVRHYIDIVIGRLWLRR